MSRIHTKVSLIFIITHIWKVKKYIEVSCICTLLINDNRISVIVLMALGIYIVCHELYGISSALFLLSNNVYSWLDSSNDKSCILTLQITLSIDQYILFLYVILSIDIKKQLCLFECNNCVCCYGLTI